ncbi:hypothetical protein GCM10010254_60490 [Streptomyces chromofuscus]|nr:hypothetical protein GCM10010254_60490 [Streptomyces chromofuscus]
MLLITRTDDRRVRAGPGPDVSPVSDLLLRQRDRCDGGNGRSGSALCSSTSWPCGGGAACEAAPGEDRPVRAGTRQDDRRKAEQPCTPPPLPGGPTSEEKEAA